MTRNLDWHLTVAPQGGLGNRLRALFSAGFLARKLQVRFDLIWYKNQDLNCDFERLFETPDIVKSVRNVTSFGVYGKLVRRVINAWYQFTSDDAEIGLVSREFILRYSNSQLSASPRRIFLETSEDLFPFSNGDFSVVPSLSVLRIVELYRVKLSNAVGLHIRRSDNTRAMEVSTIDAFENSITSILRMHPDAMFYLATDCQETENSLVGKFGTRIMIHQKRSRRRDDPIGMEDSMVDLICLSHCRFIIGSFWSTFSGFAGLIGQKKLLLVISPLVSDQS